MSAPRFQSLRLDPRESIANRTRTAPTAAQTTALAAAAARMIPTTAAGRRRTYGIFSWYRTTALLALRRGELALVSIVVFVLVVLHSIRWMERDGKYLCRFLFVPIRTGMRVLLLPFFLPRSRCGARGIARFGDTRPVSADGS